MERACSSAAEAGTNLEAEAHIRRRGATLAMVFDRHRAGEAEMKARTKFYEHRVT
jgi:hypothetical protein